MDTDPKSETDELPITFSVGDDDRPASAKKIVQGLRDAVLIGEEAARVLACLQEQGSHESSFRYLDGDYVRRARLPALVAASEDELPNYAESKPHVETVQPGEFCGHLVTYVRFSIDGEVMYQNVDHKARYMKESIQTNAAFAVRLGKKAVSMEVGGDSYCLKEPRPGEPITEWTKLRKEFSEKLASETIFLRTIKKYNREVKRHAKTKALEALAKKVIFEQHSERLLRRMYELAPVALIMKS